jgi:hypothetical protein
MRNLARTPEITVRLGTRDSPELPATGRLVDPQSEEDSDARARLVQKYTARWSGDLTSWGRNAIVAALDLRAAP